MPDARLARARQSLPEGYVYQPPRRPSPTQISKAAFDHVGYLYERVYGSDREAYRRYLYDHWNVIEGESFGTNSDPGDEVDLQSTDQVPDTDRTA